MVDPGSKTPSDKVRIYAREIVAYPSFNEDGALHVAI
jgi:hypothetical protein